MPSNEARDTYAGSPVWPKPEMCAMVSFGLTSHSASSVMPHFAIWPPRKPSTRMSA